MKIYNETYKPRIPYIPAPVDTVVSLHKRRGKYVMINSQLWKWNQFNETINAYSATGVHLTTKLSDIITEGEQTEVTQHVISTWIRRAAP
jgi:hypothetical protein